MDHILSPAPIPNEETLSRGECHAPLSDSKGLQSSSDESTVITSHCEDTPNTIPAIVVNDKNQTKLMIDVLDPSASPTISTVDQEAIDHVDSSDMTALLHAVKHGRTGFVKLLIRKKANLEYHTKDTLITPLMLAAQREHGNIAKLLIDNLACISSKDIQGRTALKHAQENFSVECVRLLIEAEKLEKRSNSINSIDSKIQANSGLNNTNDSASSDMKRLEEESDSDSDDNDEISLGACADDELEIESNNIDGFSSSDEELCVSKESVFSEKNIETWNVDDVCEFLSSQAVDALIISTFRLFNVTGSMIMTDFLNGSIGHAHMKSIGIDKRTDQVRLSRIFERAIVGDNYALSKHNKNDKKDNKELKKGSQILFEHSNTYEITNIIEPNRLYEAKNVKTNEQVIIKYCHKHQLSNHEAQDLFCLHEYGIQRNIINMYDFNERCIVLEKAYTDKWFGSNKMTKPLSCIMVREIALQLAKGLYRMHETLFIHTSLSLSNITVSANSSGIIQSCKWIDLDELVLRGEKIGIKNIKYASPERILQGDNYIADYQCDVWSFGMLILEMLVGSPYFDTSLSSIISAEIITLSYGFAFEKYPYLKQILTPIWIQLINDLLHPNPEERITISNALKWIVLRSQLSIKERKQSEGFTFRLQDVKGNLSISSNDNYNLLQSIYSSSFSDIYSISNIETIHNTTLTENFEIGCLKIQNYMDKKIVQEHWQYFKSENKYIIPRQTLSDSYRSHCFPLQQSGSLLLSSDDSGDNKRSSLLFAFYAIKNKDTINTIRINGFKNCRRNGIYGKGIYFTENALDAARMAVSDSITMNNNNNNNDDDDNSFCIIGTWLHIGCAYPITKEADYINHKNEYIQKNSVIMHPYDTYFTPSRDIILRFPIALPQYCVYFKMK